MSTVVTAKSLQALIFCTESRVMAQSGSGMIAFDGGQKLWALPSPNDNQAIVMYNQLGVGLRSADALVQQLITELGRQLVSDFAQVPVAYTARVFNDLLREQWGDQNPANFIVGGFDHKAPYASMFEIIGPSFDTPQEIYAGGSFGLTFGAQAKYAERLVRGFDSQLQAAIKNDNQLQLTPDQSSRLHQLMRQQRLAPPLTAIPPADLEALLVTLVAAQCQLQRYSPTMQSSGGQIVTAVMTPAHPVKLASYDGVA